MKKFYKQNIAQIEKVNALIETNKHQKPLVINWGDLVHKHLRKKRFPSRRQNKLTDCGDGPFKVLERIVIMPTNRVIEKHKFERYFQCG